MTWGQGQGQGQGQVESSTGRRRKPIPPERPKKLFHRVVIYHRMSQRIRARYRPGSVTSAAPGAPDAVDEGWSLVVPRFSGARERSNRQTAFREGRS